MRQLCKKNKLLLKAVLSPGHNDGSNFAQRKLDLFSFREGKKNVDVVSCLDRMHFRQIVILHNFLNYKN